MMISMVMPDYILVSIAFGHFLSYNQVKEAKSIASLSLKKL